MTKRLKLKVKKCGGLISVFGKVTGSDVVGGLFNPPSETYLDSTIPDSLLEIDGYNLVRADHPNNIKRGGVCIYYKELLPVRVISLPYIKEALLLGMTDNNKKIIVSVIYCSPSQNSSEFDLFLLNLEQLLRDISKCKPTVSIITGDFKGGLSPFKFASLKAH